MEKSLIENYEQISVAKYHAFQSTLLRAEEGQKSLSSRTMIKNAIIDYLDGKISMEDLQTYTQPKFTDGAGVLENLISAQRQVEGVVIARFTTPMLSAEEERLLANAEAGIFSSENIKLTLFEGKVLGLIKSPIKEGSEVLGYDVLFYDFSKSLRSLSSDSTDVDILDSESYQKLLFQAESVVNEGELIKVRKSGLFFITAPLGDSNYFVSAQESASLFQPIQRLAVRIAIGGLATFILYVLAAYIFLVRFTKAELAVLESSRNSLKEIAFKDQLTGAFSRHFLDIWNQSVRSDHTYAVVMMDIDGFKKINDNHGHLIGDEILQFVGETLANAIRHSDYLIRYGGDEFVLILMDTDIDDAHQFMIGIQEQLEGSLLNKLSVRFSYGIGTLAEGDRLEDRLREADRNMYENKYRNQN